MTVIDPGFRDAGLDLPALLFAGVVAATIAVLISLPVALRLPHAGAVDAEAPHAATPVRDWSACGREGLLAVQMAVLTCLPFNACSLPSRWIARDASKSSTGSCTWTSGPGASQGSDERTRTTQLLQARLARLPDLKGLALVTPPPGSARRARVPHQVRLRAPVPSLPTGGAVAVRAVDGDSSRTVGVSPVSGRMLDGNDDASQAPVAVVDRRFVRHFLGGADPLGHQIELPSGVPAEPTWFTIVG